MPRGGASKATRIPEGSNQQKLQQEKEEAQAKQAEIEKAILDNVLKQLREKVKELDQDSWMYEAPRHSHR
ncbi:hypothetical protein WJX72_000399 [[Myrmecia] bisecta]|uniref:Uncharacterized protein n=1 Tax=[Myrmecia] bisecta TaxID=41462 RepID=A0AAW1PK67_9CHLO